MATERIKAGLERLGMLTPAMFAPRVEEALSSYQAEGVDRVTELQIRQRLNQLYPTRGWLPVAIGNLPGALFHLMKEGNVEAMPGEHAASGREPVTYSLTTPQQAQA